MTAPTVESITTQSFNSGDTTHNVTMPATVNAGDLLVLGISFYVGGAITTPAGWTALCVDTIITGTSHCAIYGKLAVGTEGGTSVNVATANPALGASHVYRITGWNNISLAIGVASGTPATGTSANGNPPSCSWTWGVLDELALTFVHLNPFSVVGTITSYPTNYTSGTDTVGTDGVTGTAEIGSARRALSAAASPEDPSTFTQSNVAWVANTIVVCPLIVIAKKPTSLRMVSSFASTR